MEKLRGFLIFQSLGEVGHEGQKMISPVTYVKSPFLTVLKLWKGCGSLLQRRKVFAHSSLDPGWKMGKWAENPCETLRLSGEATEKLMPGSVINVHTEPVGPDRPVSGESDGSAKEAAQHLSWLLAVCWERGTIKGRVKVIYRCRMMAK